MTLAQRVLIATAILTLAAAAAVGLGVREAWTRTEEVRFREQFTRAVAQLELALHRDISELPALIEPLCVHDPLLDSALVDLRADRLDAAERLSLSVRTKALMKALRVDELFLVTGEGEVLGSGHSAALLGTVDAELGRAVRESAPVGVRARAPLAIDAVCLREEGGKAVGIYAARVLAPLLERVAASHGVGLTLGDPPAQPGEMRAKVTLPELGGLSLVATQSRVSLTAALRQLDTTVFAIGAVTVLGALALAWLVARGLARPIVRLSEQARAVVAGGEPRPVEAGGGRELRELAEAFNHAISDLGHMRTRLAATERIAAWREIARRVAHEIKNPLAPIRAAVETLRRLHARQDPAFEEYFEEATETVLSEVRRIAAIATEFSRFARLPAPRPVPTELEPLLRQVVGLHHSEGVGVALDAARCPAARLDRDQLTQVMTNLIQNAVDACRGRPGARVVVALRPAEPGWVELSVSDNGPGVPAERQEQLFTPYFTTKAGGTGLGLAIVQRIVVEHGGDIHYERAPSGGARFVLRLPLAGPPPAAAPGASSEL